MACRVLRCGHCEVDNAVGICKRCGRAFVISVSRAKGSTREFDDHPLEECPSDDIDTCDFCDAKVRSESLVAQARRGLQQRTCVACHTEFLSGHGL
jgi:hypothetical protein